MIALDSNVIVALLSDDDALNTVAKSAMLSASRQVGWVICGAVFIELSALPNHPHWDLEEVLRTARIQVDWTMEEAIWREAARAGRDWYMRKRSGNPLPRRVPADFLIGAHALIRGAELLTFDKRTFRIAFPKLTILSL